MESTPSSLPRDWWNCPLCRKASGKASQLKGLDFLVNLFLTSPQTSRLFLLLNWGSRFQKRDDLGQRTLAEFRMALSKAPSELSTPWRSEEMAHAGWQVWFTCALMLNFVHLCCLMPLALGPGQFLYLHWPLQHDSVKLARREFQNFLFVFSGKQGLADSFQIHPWACWRMAPELRIDSTFSKACTIFFQKLKNWQQSL